MSNGYSSVAASVSFESLEGGDYCVGIWIGSIFICKCTSGFRVNFGKQVLVPCQVGAGLVPSSENEIFKIKVKF